MPPMLPDMAHGDNIAIAEPGIPRVNQPAPSERYLYSMAICLAFALVLFLGFLFWPSSKHPTRDEDSALGRHSVSCSSSSCVQNAVYLSNLLSWRDVNPCNDFYAFVCRRWKSRFATPLKDTSVSTDDDYAAFLEDVLYTSIRNDSGSSKILRPLRYLHDKCMNVKLIEDGGWNALFELMSDLSLDGFPLTPPVRDSLSVWSTAANILRMSGSAALLSVGVASHAASSKTNIVSVGPPELLTTAANVDANEAIRLYTAAVFAAIKALKKDYVPPVEILAIVKFASDLEKLGQSRMNTDASKIDILDSRSDMFEFLTAVFRGREKSIFTGARSYIAIHSPEFFSDVIDMVANSEPHTVMNYLGVRLMIQIAPFIPEAGLTNFYTTMVFGKHQMDLPRWQLCVRATEKALYPLVHSVLFHDTRLKASMPSIVEVVSKAIVAFIAEVDASSLFEDSSKAAIHRILSKVAVNIVSPSWINDTASIANYIDGLPDLKATRRGLETYVAFFQHTFFDTLSRGTRTRWSRSIFSATCWYESYPRTVYVPLVAFNVTQAFQGSDDDYVQLSRLAPRLSRCLLDMLMEESNSTDGTVRWLTETSQSRLADAEKCLRGRANSEGLRRLRDVLAAGVALRLFRKSDAAKQDLVTSLMNGRVMTITQVFFVYLMLQSCETVDGPERSWPAGVDDWSIALRDSGDFSKAFNCTTGSPMSTKQGCVG
ncbi:endothelin-converting enzyme 1-like [Rhipicephalus microplus]|uniref:endothelin-converting enzyme 1-like n=1 Tax=Rhipicephalus microplus TaxID=6941 RepID=UPI003F6CCF90